MNKIIAVITLIAALSLGVTGIALSQDELNESQINTILSTAFTELKNVPVNACITLPGAAAELPADIETASLQTMEGTVRKDVAALIKHGLITVQFNTGKGAPTVKKPGYTAIEKDVSLSHVEVTPFGKPFYRYDESKSSGALNGKKGLYTDNRFCAHIVYGGMKKFMKPTKNPFDNNPHLVTWVDFLWKPDESKTAWLADKDLKNSLGFFPEKDGWAHRGILLEQNDDGRWELGTEPYTIRW
ncbi:hypothetical protein [Limnobaculum parvum]|uniref:Uncharacterized protein n=1 Tax=Limnobaculum parvum TaxID=2172103 RepID=A0A2Y9TZA7_9GAMM|nr:hypothetical protein [Limnobaculum parvum]AWH88714.1 hypothetical protein HYN51_09170 [Limnobaculum parvum]